MEDLLIIIPFYEDCDIRRKNLFDLVKRLNIYKLKYVIIMAMNSKTTLPIWDHEDFPDKSIRDHTEVFFVGDMEFPKSEMINYAVGVIDRTKYKYAAWHDCDVMFASDAYQNAYDSLKSGTKFLYPYNGQFINIKGYDYSTQNMANAETQILHEDSCGGALFFDIKTFIEIGGMNENFTGWGFEDDELRCRIAKYGYPIVRSVDHPCYHLDHPRGERSSSQHAHYEANKKEFEKIREMSLEEIKKHKISIFSEKSFTFD